jgi:hypothetical protein
MPHFHHTHMDQWRIVVPGPNASELLVRRDRRGFVLPEVLVPRDQRLARHLNEQVRRNWQLSILSIVPIDSGAQTGETDIAQYHVAELIPRGTALPPDWYWVDSASLTAQAFRDARDFDAARMFFNPWSSAKEDGPFAHVGWFENLSAWVQSIAKSRTLEWSGRFEQFHAAACFSLIRFGTSPQALWFKAVGEPSTREFQITQTLANRLPDYVPRLVAVRPDCNGWLAEECPGKILHECSDPDLWRKVASTLAQLQTDSIPHIEELLCAGAHPLQAVLSESAFERFVRVSTALFSENSDHDVLNPTADDLNEIVVRAREGIGHLRTLCIPDALGHLDLNAGNIVSSREQCTYLDWAEAYVGYPFLTFEYLRQAFRRKFGRDAQDESLVVEAYLAAWDRGYPHETVREAWAITPFVALFTYTVRCIAASEQHLNSAPSLADYVRSLIRKLKRELSTCRTMAAGVR